MTSCCTQFAERFASFVSFATLSKTRVRRGMNEQASAWLTGVEGLPELHERLKRVVIYNREAFEVIQQTDSEQTLFYLDLPYLQETRSAKNAYKHEVTPEYHEALLELLSGIQGKFILSGYPSKMYDDAAQKHGWKRAEYAIPNNASRNKIKDTKTECIWMNYDYEVTKPA